MAGDEKPRLRLELAHVLFLDIVGYSKLRTAEQSACIQLLRDIVRQTEQVRAAETQGKLLRLPTGDGGALVFRSLEAPVLCAIELATALQSHPELPVRMGIHSGPVNEVTDLNEQANIAGAGINLAQRVMDCGDAGHILLSKHAAEDLEDHDEWQPFLHDLGECEIKHGQRLRVVNFYNDAVGNRAVPAGIQQARARDRTKKSSRAYFIGATAVAVLLVLAGTLFFLRSFGKPIAKIAQKSIAVLPFANTTNDLSNEYFSDGLSEELISGLTRLNDLKVIGRNSSFQFKNTTEDSRIIGEKLGVFYLLEGSVRKSMDRVRIAVSLVKSADGTNVWSQTYEKELKDIFALQSEIAAAVAKEMQVTLLEGKSGTFATGAIPSNENIDAYQALLQGNFYAARHSADDSRTAIGFFEQAIKLDPGYALAQANLSIVASNLVYNFGNLASKEGKAIADQAREAADAAIRLDPDLSEAHLAKGTYLRIIDLNYAAAEGECRRALELAPKSTGALLNLALLKAFSGHFDEAVELSERQIAIDPVNNGASLNYAGYLAAVGRFDEAEAVLHKAISRHPSSSQTYMALTRLLIQRGQPGAALEAARKEPDPFFRTYSLAIAYFAGGNQTQADAQLKKLIDEDADDAGSQIASIYALRKEPDKVFEWLERAWLNHDPGVSEITVDPFTRTYKDDPRFIAFAQKIGIMPKTSANL